MTIWNPSLAPGKPRYLAIADALAADVRAGRLAPGDQLPPHRQLADNIGVSLGTVTRALALAERRGLIHGQIGRGTYIGTRHLDAFPGPGGETGSNMDLTWPLYEHDPDLAGALREVAANPSCQRLLQYAPNAGLDRHREAGASWAGRFGVDACPGNVAVCAGTQHALSVVLTAVTQPGDTIFCESLTYPGLKALARLLHLKVVGLPMDQHGLVPEAFEAACRMRRGKLLYTIPTVHNPTARTLSQARRRDIAGIARDHDVKILEDAVHHLLASHPPAPISTHAPEVSFFVAGLSKVVAGGLRVAFLVTPPAWMDRIAHGIWATQWMASPLCAEIATGWIQDGTADQTVARKRDEARARVELAREKLTGCILACPARSYHAWLTLPDPWESEAFALEARRRGAAVTPAASFSVGPEPVPNAVRISLSGPASRPDLAAGLEVIAQILSEIPDPGAMIV